MILPSGEKIEPGSSALDVRQNSYPNCHAISSYREVLEHPNMPRPEAVSSDDKLYVQLPGYKDILEYSSIPDSAVAKTKDLYALLVLKALDDAKKKEYPNLVGAPPAVDLMYLTGLKATSSNRRAVDDRPPSETLMISDANVDALVVTTMERLPWWKKLTSEHAYAVDLIEKAKQTVTLVDTDGSLVTVSFLEFDRQVINVDRISQRTVDLRLGN